jgi:hypothetical protein
MSLLVSLLRRQQFRAALNDYALSLVAIRSLSTNGNTGNGTGGFDVHKPSIKITENYSLVAKVPILDLEQTFVKREELKHDKEGHHGKLKIKSPAKEEGKVHEDKRRYVEIEAPKEEVEHISVTAGNKAMYVTKVGAGANLALAISKGTIGFSIASTGLIADAANSLGDLLSDAVVYYSITEARKSATPDRPWGRGKIEPLGKFFLVFMLLLYLH